MTASIGVATSRGLLAAADRAMRQAKADGSRYRVFDATMNECALQRLHIEAGLHHAHARREFVLHYQPSIDLRTGAVVSVEALIRWNHPERGLLPPAEFIPIAEKTGSVAKITEWVLHHACQQARDWQDAGAPPLRIAVNACPRELSGGLSGMVHDALGASRLAADRLEIEVTERFLGHDDAVPGRTLRALRQPGVQIALDDFGIDYSSLGRLQTLPVDAIKIDRSFIASPDPTHAIAKSIITLAANLGLRSIAEGVEQPQQLTWLEDAGCDAAAGFFICEPRPVDEMTAWLLSRR